MCTDALGRITDVYEDPTPTGRNYHSQYTYDSMGRIASFAQCTPYNCGSSFWQMDYTYDLGGDVTSWTHPAGFTIANNINSAQQVTQVSQLPSDSTHPANLIRSVSYTPWGAEQTLENGCASSSGQEQGCTDTVETYAYNNRMQPVMIELGDTSNASADYCLVYNYYANVGNPGSCAVPSQGTGDNGNVRGYLYQDNVNPSLSHAAAYSYDALNRLATAAATGSATYNFTFEQGSGISYAGYDRWGNMTCVMNGSTNGVCPSYSFSSANNQITNSGYTYDAAGNLTSDGQYTYQWDAAGRLTSVTQGSTVWAMNTYDALGQRVENNDPQWDRIEYPRDPEGNHLGNYLVNAANWLDTSSPGRGLFEYYEGDTRFYHHDQLGSVTVLTGSSGAEATDGLLTPWGLGWTGVGSTGEMLFGGFQDHDINQIWPADHRFLDPNLGRRLTPDPLGGDITNPQSLNRYTYALNNPTTLTDPLGLGDLNPADPCSDPNYFFSYAECGGPPPGGCVAYGTEGCIPPPIGFPVGGGAGGSTGSTVGTTTTVTPPAGSHGPAAASALLSHRFRLTEGGIPAAGGADASEGNDSK